MAFLDNSGDIILDAVLTDEGRLRLARGDGSFTIVKFALGDDEINYESYDPNDTRGTAFYAIEILQTPVLEAFTNDTSTMKSKLLSIPRTNILYLPVILLNQVLGVAKDSGTNAILVTCDDETTKAWATGDYSSTPYLNGFDMTSGLSLRADQGLNTSEISPTMDLDVDLVETQYIVEIDSRLGELYSTAGSRTSWSYINDDSIASYSLSRSSRPITSTAISARGAARGAVSADNYVTENTSVTRSPDEVIDGPRGTILECKVRASMELQTSTYLFDLLGGTFNLGTSPVVPHYFIDTTMRITGATTGYRIDIPIRFVKKV
jgi:hypothetical protein